MTKLKNQSFARSWEFNYMVNLYFEMYNWSDIHVKEFDECIKFMGLKGVLIG